MQSRYDPVLKIMAKTEYRDEIFFRVAGDQYLEVAYGREGVSPRLEDILVKIFRVRVVDNKVKDANISGLLKTVTGIRTNLYKFDPLKTSMSKIVDEISSIESGVENIGDYEIETRLLKLPLVFDSRGVQLAIEKYLREIKPEAVNCENGSNLNYVASYNGIAVEELKQKFLKTEWIAALVGAFTVGEPFCYPLDPTCAITAPKYNPPKTWTPEGIVDFAGFCSSIYGMPGGGGYQMIGQTVPVYQDSQKHPQFKNSKALLRSSDILQYYEITQEELDEIYRLVHEESRWEYDIRERKFSLREWLSYCRSVEAETQEFIQKQEFGRKVTPLP